MNVRDCIRAWHDRNIKAHSKRYAHARVRSPHPFEGYTDQELREAYKDVQRHLSKMAGLYGADPLIDKKILIEEEMRTRGMDSSDWCE